MIALALISPILTANFSNAEMIVLTEVLAQSYGPLKRRDVFLDPAQIEHYSGLHRNNARAAIKSLVAAHVLGTNKNGSYHFLKNWEAWTPGRKPFAERLSGGLVRFAMSTFDRFGLPKKSKVSPIPVDCDNQVSVPIQADIISTDGPIQATPAPNLFLNPTGLGSGGQGQSNGIVGTIGTRTDAGAQKELREEKHTEPVCEKPFGEEMPNGMTRVGKPTYRHSQASIDRARAAVDDVFGMLEYGMKVSWSASEVEHLESFVTAAEDARHLKPTPSWKYFMGMVRARDANGGKSTAPKRVRYEDRPAPPSSSLKGQNLPDEGYEELQMAGLKPRAAGNVAAATRTARRLDVEPESAT